MVFRKSLFTGTFVALTLLTLLVSCPSPLAGADSPELREFKIRTFGDIPPLGKIAEKAAMKEVPLSLAKAKNAKQVMEFLGLKLSGLQKEFLDKNKFLVIPKAQTKFSGELNFAQGEPDNWDEMLGMFDEIGGPTDELLRKPENTRLVTPAPFLHAFHIIFRNTLEFLEKTELGPMVQDFAEGMRTAALKRKGEAKGPLAKRFETIAAQFTVASVLVKNAYRGELRRVPGEGENPSKAPLDEDDAVDSAMKLLDDSKKDFSDEIFQKMKTEIGKIYQAGGIDNSPLFSEYSKDGELKCDFTQYKPRGHYNKNSALRAYFRAMMFLGRNAYFLNTRPGITDSILISFLMNEPDASGTPLLEKWGKVMEFTTFFAGFSDDLTYSQWREFLAPRIGKGGFDPGRAMDETFLASLEKDLGTLPSPKIFSEAMCSPKVKEKGKQAILDAAKSFRIFGQRFTFDGWIFEKLCAGEEKTGIRLPSTPSALFVPAAMGDSRAQELVKVFLGKPDQGFSDKEIQDFMGELGKVAAEIGKIKESEWFSNLAAVWLKTLGTLTAKWGEGFPQYMQSPMFPIKQIEDFLGSYSELKHDTLLYAKPKYAEYGDGGDEGKAPPVPRGLVEPNLRFWHELRRMIDYTLSGFERLKIMESEKEEYGVLNMLKRHVDLCIALSEKELADKPISVDEYEKLRTMRLTPCASPFESQVYEDEDRRAALVADIVTDLEKGRILYEGTGEPGFLLALIGTEKECRLSLGVCFNHFEFTQPMGERLTDQEWQEKVYKSPKELPPKGFWYEELMLK